MYLDIHRIVGDCGHANKFKSKQVYKYNKTLLHVKSSDIIKGHLNKFNQPLEQNGPPRAMLNVNVYFY